MRHWEFQKEIKDPATAYVSGEAEVNGRIGLPGKESRLQSDFVVDGGWDFISINPVTLQRS